MIKIIVGRKGGRGREGRPGSYFARISIEEGRYLISRCFIEWNSVIVDIVNLSSVSYFIPFLVSEHTRSVENCVFSTEHQTFFFGLLHIVQKPL